MPSEWDELVRDAAKKLDTADHEREMHAAKAHEEATELDQRFKEVAKTYTRLATDFFHKLSARGMGRTHTYTQTYTFYRIKEPFFGSRVKPVDLVLVEGAGMSWYRAGESSTGPLSSYPRSLAIGTDIGPMIMSPFRVTDRIPYQVYQWARKSSEEVVGLKSMLDDAREHGQPPEILVDCLKNALARWAAEHWRDLQLDLP
jgi:hypothetical protein